MVERLMDEKLMDEKLMDEKQSDKLHLPMPRRLMAIGLCTGFSAFLSFSLWHGVANAFNAGAIGDAARVLAGDESFLVSSALIVFGGRMFLALGVAAAVDSVPGWLRKTCGGPAVHAAIAALLTRDEMQQRGPGE